jgi:hypothetical protein
MPDQITPLRAITCYSQSHQVLFDEMIASFPWEDGLELTVRLVEQDGDGVFGNAGWQRSTARKIEFTLEVLEQLPENGLLLWVDVDVVFFRPVRGDLVTLMDTMRADILFQSDRSELCAGFFVARKNSRTLDFFREVLRIIPEKGDDQTAINSLIASFGIRFGLLPRRYYNIGIDSGEAWNGRSPVRFPKSPTVFHANWTHGIENKLKLIALARQKIGSSVGGQPVAELPAA